MHNPDPRTPPWRDRYPTGHGLRHGPLVAPSQHPRLPFHWKRTPARLGAERKSHQKFPDLRIYTISVPQDLTHDVSHFPAGMSVGFYPRSRSDLRPAYARIVEASTSFPVSPEQGCAARLGRAKMHAWRVQFRMFWARHALHAPI